MEQHLHALPSGYQLNEYRIERVIGSGGFGITYYAWDTHLDKPVAIKEYLPNEFAVRVDGITVSPKSTADHQDYQWGLERFLDEARTLARFRHANLNEVHRFFEAHGTAYLVLEYIEGETLADLLAREGRLDQDRLLRLLREMLSGLEEVHKAGFVHRDVKPGNIMLRRDGSSVLLDFGAARQAIGQRSQAVTSILTPGYAPIEQYDQKADDVGPWTDLYALGMVAYRCISGVRDHDLLDAVARGRLQYKGQSDQDMLPAASLGRGRYDEALLDAIDWAIKVGEDERPPSASAMRDALSGGARVQTSPSAAPSRHAGAAGGAAQPAPPAQAGSGTSPGLIIGIVLLVLAVAGGGIYYVMHGGAAGNGHLQVSVNVPGAQVSLDGQARGTAAPDAPLRIQELAPGSYSLRVERSGYVPFSGNVSVGGGEWKQLAVDLQQVPRKPYEPETVLIRGGSFDMGCVSGRGCEDDEQPVHRVSVGDFEMGAHEVTFAQWDACVSDGGCSHRPDDAGWGRGQRPVINVGWQDAQQYVRWLSRKTGKNYRLPTEAEWEYAARAGTRTPFSFNGAISPDRANYDGSASFEGSPTGVDRRKTMPVGSFAANAWGLYDMHGNVWEVLDDCWHESYAGAPTDGSAWSSGGDCGKRVVRSGAWNDNPDKLRSANRYGDGDNVRDSLTGFRVALSLADAGGSRAGGATPPDSVPDQPPPPISFTGHLQVDVNVAGARIELDGSSRGNAAPGSPLRVQDLSTGRHRLRVSRDGYESVERSVQINLNQWTREVVQLQRRPTTGELVVRSNVSGDTVRIDGRDVGSTSPNPHQLEAGSYRLQVSKRGYLPFETQVSIEVGQRRTVRVQLVPERLPFEPEMVFIRGGSYDMGCQDGSDCEDDEKPVHRVRLDAFEIGKHEVTFAQWDACVDDGGCSHRPDDRGWGRGSRPVINVSWQDAQQYLRWLNRRTGKNYRLPTESEWEYAARAGSSGKYSFGDSIHTGRANYQGNSTKPVGSYAANAWGLHDMHGNVWEVLQDCWHSDYRGAPSDGRAWTSGGDCSKRSVRSGAWNDDPDKLRSANRYGDGDDVRDGLTGLRLARSLN